MARTLMFAIVFLVACGAADADEQKTRGAYIGGSAGSAEFDDDGALGGFYDDLDTSFMVFGGYRFFKNFGVEARLGSLGSLRGSRIHLHSHGLIGVVLDTSAQKVQHLLTDIFKLQAKIH